jgi:hypothetical protein
VPPSDTLRFGSTGHEDSDTNSEFMQFSGHWEQRSLTPDWYLRYHEKLMPVPVLEVGFLQDYERNQNGKAMLDMWLLGGGVRTVLGA